MSNLILIKFLHFLPSDADISLLHCLYMKYCCLQHWMLKELLLDPLPEEHLQLKKKKNCSHITALKGKKLQYYSQIVSLNQFNDMWKNLFITNRHIN